MVTSNNLAGNYSYSGQPGGWPTEFRRRLWLQTTPLS